jgi:hypothetical protein
MIYGHFRGGRFTLICDPARQIVRFTPVPRKLFLHEPFLDQESRRHVMFLGREDILDLAAGINLPTQPQADAPSNTPDDVPF